MDTSNVSQAISQAASAGHITQISSSALLANLNANTIPATIGTQVPLLETTTPMVVSLVIDSTGSLSGFEPTVIKSVNDCAMDFQKMRTKTGQEMYFSVKEFSRRSYGGSYLRTIQDFVHIQDFVPLTVSDYNTDGMTPLNDATMDGITQTMAFGSSVFSFGATGVQEVTIVISDGQDNDSQRSADDVARLLKELNTKPNFVAAFIGVGNFPYEAVAKSMGFLDGNIIAVDKTVSGITHALKLVSSSVGSRSQKSLANQPVSSGDFFATI